MDGITDILSFIIQCMAAFWNFLYSGSGYIGLALIAGFVLRKVIKFFKQIF